MRPALFHGGFDERFSVVGIVGFDLLLCSENIKGEPLMSYEGICFDGQSSEGLDKQAIMDLLIQWRSTDVKPEFPAGWTAYRDATLDPEWDKPRTYAARYCCEDDREYWVPVVTLNWKNETILHGGFTTHCSGDCGYCGATLDGEMYCPSCGSC